MALWQCHWAPNLLKAPFQLALVKYDSLLVPLQQCQEEQLKIPDLLPDIMKMMKVTFSKQQVASDIQQSVLLVQSTSQVCLLLLQSKQSAPLWVIITGRQERGRCDAILCNTLFLQTQDGLYLLCIYFLSDVTLHNCTWSGVVRNIAFFPPQFLFSSLSKK